MPLRGGGADKVGNRYEGRWTVKCMAEVLAEHASTIRLEPIGPEGEGVEFWIRYPERLEYHQVKRQHSGRGRWTIAALRENGVLDTIHQKLKESIAHFVFVSIDSARELDELGDRARRASSWKEFRDECLTENLSAAFDSLAKAWISSTPLQIYELLQRVHVEPIGESTLQQFNEARLIPLVDGDPAVITAVLTQFALDKVHQELRAHDIWQELEQRGFRRRQWGNEPTVLAAVADANGSFVRSAKRDAILSTLIPRSEAGSIVQALKSSSPKRVFVLAGDAGVGKSSVLVEVVEQVAQQCRPFLAFRLDTLTSTPNAAELGRQLQLPGSPAHVLASIAGEGDSFLILDQVDYVSLTSGRHPQFFECVDELLGQAQSYPSMRVLLACRSFDLENDPRLRRLVEQGDLVETYRVGRLAEQTVRDVLSKTGLNPEQLTAKQLDLLSLPLHLSLLTGMSDSQANDLGFETAKDLYDKFWEHKQQQISARLGNAVEWNAIIDVLCHRMSEDQVLSVRKDVLDDFPLKSVQVMVSEHILVFENKRYSFFHQTFFDYAFARNFTRRGQRLSELLFGGEQSLFRRAQVRQILAYQREADRDRYLDDLQTLISDPRIRPHLLQVVAAYIAALQDPTEEEWRLVAPRVTNRDEVAHWGVWRGWFRSVPWFRLLDSLGEIQRWIQSGDSWLLSQAVTLLSKVQKEEQERVAEMVEPFVGSSPEWNNALLYLMQTGDLAASRRFFELFQRMVDEGLFDTEDQRPQGGLGTLMFVQTLVKSRPDWACEAIGHYFRRRLTSSVSNGQPNPFADQHGAIPLHSHDGRILVEAATHAPKAFVREVLPVVLLIMILNEKNEGLPLHRDAIWSYQYFLDDELSMDTALLKAATRALVSLAATEPHDFEAAACLLKTRPLETATYLLLRGYAANGTLFAEEAGRFILEHPECWDIGVTPWTVREVIRSISPHCSPSLLTELEDAILSYYPKREKSAYGQGDFGRSQFILLSGMPESFRSTKATQRLQELKRKFGFDPSPPRPEQVELYAVGSPIRGEALSKMSNRHWLSAIQRYRNDHDGGWINDRPIGGAIELSRALEEEVKKDPNRFAWLVLQFPDDTNSHYFTAVLDGLAGTQETLDGDNLYAVIRRCHALPRKPCGGVIARTVRRHAQELPPVVMDIISWYALNDPDPEPGRRSIWPADPNDNRSYLLDEGLNSNRGAAVVAIASLLFGRPDYLPALEPALRGLVRDPSVAVRAWGAQCLLAILKTNRELAVELFIKLCGADDALLGTRYVESFLNYALRTHFPLLLPIVERMLASEDPKVRKAGARRACLAALDLPEAQPLAESCIFGEEPLRLGAAQVFAANLRDARFRTYCETRLQRLFHDGSKSVRDGAAVCFRRFEGDDLKEYADLAHTFVSSPAFEDNYDDLVEALIRSTASLHELTVTVCERYMDLFGTDSGNIATRAAAAADRVARLTVRVYSQAKDPVLITRCVDLIDRMTLSATYGLDGALESFER